MAIDFERDVQVDEAEQARERQREQERHERVTEAATAGVRLAHHAAAATGGEHADAPSVATPLGALLSVGESLETGLTDGAADDRLTRFPELRNVSLAEGAGARFPELSDSGPSEQRSSEDTHELAR